MLRKILTEMDNILKYDRGKHEFPNLFLTNTGAIRILQSDLNNGNREPNVVSHFTEKLCII
jgi:hypothetical protein